MELERVVDLPQLHPEDLVEVATRGCKPRTEEVCFDQRQCRRIPELRSSMRRHDTPMPVIIALPQIEIHVAAIRSDHDKRVVETQRIDEIPASCVIGRP